MPCTNKECPFFVEGQYWNGISWPLWVTFIGGISSSYLLSLTLIFAEILTSDLIMEAERMCNTQACLSRQRHLSWVTHKFLKFKPSTVRPSLFVMKSWVYYCYYHTLPPTEWCSKVKHWIDHISKLADLRDSIITNYGTEAKIDWEVLHNAGCTCDDTDLPHHVSSVEEIAFMMYELRVSLESWVSDLGKPLAVTVARSSLDDFCPPDQVENIQKDTLEVISSTLQQVVVHLLYQ